MARFFFSAFPFRFSLSLRSFLFFFFCSFPLFFALRPALARSSSLSFIFSPPLLSSSTSLLLFGRVHECFSIQLRITASLTAWRLGILLRARRRKKYRMDTCSWPRQCVWIGRRGSIPFVGVLPTVILSKEPTHHPWVQSCMDLLRDLFEIQFQGFVL